MHLPKVLNKRALPGRKLPEGAVYIGRPSRWGNPYRIGRDGDRAEVMAKYADHLETRLADPAFRAALLDLAQADALVCWCAPEPCHGDLLVAAMTRLLADGGSG